MENKERSFHDDRQYVVVINKEGPIPLRHIVSIYDEYDEEKFKKDYYEIYHELQGDEFIHCKSHEEMMDFVDGLTPTK